MLLEKRVTFGATPGNRPQHAAVLTQRHLEVAVFQASRAVDDLDAGRREYRLRISGAEGCEAHDLRGHRAAQLAKAEPRVDAEPGTKVIGPEALVGVGVQARAQLANPSAIEREPGRDFVPAEPRHDVAA